MNKHLIFLFLIVLLAGLLRFYKISENPPGLYIDEVSIGNNAYAILKTGADEFGQRYPLAFKSFGDYKMPVYIYMTAASMGIFGKNEFAIRSPSAFFGTLTIVAFYLLIFELAALIDSKKQLRIEPRWLALLSALLLAISSWHIQFSRAGFEVTVGVFLFVLASWLLVLFWKRTQLTFLFSSFFLYAMTMYTYHTFRISAPITILASAGVLIRLLPKYRAQILTAIAFFLLVALPIILFSLTPEGTSRFGGTSAFSEYKTSSLLQEVIVYPMVFLKDYLSFFSLPFLFNFGDGIGRHQIPGFGLLPYWQLPFLLFGIYALFRIKQSKAIFIVLFFLLISPLPAAVARPSPHTLRVLLMVIPILIIVSIGIVSFLRYFGKWAKYIVLGMVALACFQFISYVEFYYVQYPRTNVLDWGGGYKELVLKTATHKKNYQHIIIDDNLSAAHYYFRFYDPAVEPLLVSDTWQKPTQWQSQKVLFIRPFYGSATSRKKVDTVYLPNLNHDIFAEFWELE